ncbi:MAG: type 2 isopentenyl-diphosphate Delta-isomerase [Chloroflexi bacterium]|nr:type 2 isopentenyl-diphosphate Delta-isomerase [Chloroflexota bacterium]
MTTEDSHSNRKQEHLEICLTQDVRSGTTTGLERYALLHQALPEMALDEVDTATHFLGHALRAPLLISAMTGGTQEARKINRRLAIAAQSLGLAMSLGSQRAAIEDPRLLPTYQVRDVAPDILLFANLGAVQLNYGYGATECRQAVESVGADALVLHLNPLQEALQRDGNTNFRGLAERIADICQAMPCPVLVKEVGWGLSAWVAQVLCQAGVAALDIGGAGGTSWSQVERHRSASAAEAQVAEAFGDWGLSTADALVAVRQACPNLPLIASGGITDGVMACKCLALGADLVGMAYPLLQPAMESEQAVVAKLAVVLRQLRIAMFCVGARTIKALDRSRLFTRS